MKNTIAILTLLIGASTLISGETNAGISDNAKKAAASASKAVVKAGTAAANKVIADVTPVVNKAISDATKTAQAAATEAIKRGVTQATNQAMAIMVKGMTSPAATEAMTGAEAAAD